MHLDYHPEMSKEQFQSANSEISKCHFGTLNGTLKITLDELAILKKLQKNSMITQLVLAEETGKSLRTIKREMNDLKEKGYIRRLNGKRNGKWEILIDIPEK